jgi:excisionase family DNA binding protein
VFDYSSGMEYTNGQRQSRVGSTPVGSTPVGSTPVEAGEPGYLRTYEVAEILHVSPKTVTRWAKDGKLPFSRTLGGHRRYPEDEIRTLADDLRVRPG